MLFNRPQNNDCIHRQKPYTTLLNQSVPLYQMRGKASLQMLELHKWFISSLMSDYSF